MSADVQVCYDSEGGVIATKDLTLTPPWIVVLSKSYEGRYFFLNTDTHQSLWSLPPHLLSTTDVNEDNDLKGVQERRDTADTPTGVESSIELPISIIPHKVSHQDATLLQLDLLQGKAESEFRKPSEPLLPIEPCGGLPRVGGSMDSFISPNVKTKPNRTVSLSKSIREKFNIWSLSPSKASSTSKTSFSFGSSIDKPLFDEEFDRLPTMDILREDEEEDPMFSVTEGLGRGGYSVVVKAQHLISKKCLAMKVIPKNVSDIKLKRDVHKGQIIFELKVMTKIESSPFLQRCHYTFESKSSIFFLLDLNSGGDLFYHLVKRIEDGNGFSEKECQIMLAEIYLALEHLHLHKIIHRDIKIENIMLTSEGHVKLVDFGLAIEMEDTDTQVISSAGSLLYMSPELIKNRIGGRFTDWWAYGVLAHELLTGSTPWSSLTDSKLIKWEVVHKVVLPPSFLSRQSVKFISSLLNLNFSKRLGTRRDDDIKASSFFKNVNWDKTAKLQCPPAFVPDAINVNKEDQDGALEGYYDVMNTADVECENTWMLGLEEYTKFLM